METGMTSVQAGNQVTANLPTGQSQAIRRVNRLIQQVAGFNSNVLILGESGTGKEVVARAIHDSSHRRDKPFVAINCGAIPSELLESELFGHEKGAFTGALASRRGRFELAEGGTIFLDEIGDMNPAMQVKLLRVLQERAFERVGSCTTQTCDVRVIAATHRNLEECIAKGTFREDLFYRLNVVPVEMPALRERKGDLPYLIASLADRVHAMHGQPVRLKGEAVAALEQYRWPGNVRELSNLLERLAIESAGAPIGIAELPVRYRPAGWIPADDAEAEFDDLPTHQAAYVAVDAEPSVDAMDAELTPSDVDALLEAGSELEPAVTSAHALHGELPAGGMDLKQYLEDLEHMLIRKALEAADGTVAQAARLLGLRRTTLVEKLRKYGLAANEAVATGT
jgi:sigma-54 specific flagellar transcriptional regulator A